MSTSSWDTNKLLVDFVQAEPGIRLVKQFNELSAFPQFVQQQDDNIIKISILTADADSPFWKLRGDRAAMIGAIFEFLDIGTQNLKAKTFLQKVIDYQHSAVAECWLAYLQMQYNVDFTDWSITKETYDMLITESARQRGANEDAVSYANWRVKLRSQIRALGDDLKAIEPKIFKDSKMARPVAIEMAKIKNYPEKYARTAHV